MVLEATMLCIDNSDFSRNSDYPTTRLEAQKDAMNLLAGAKSQDNPENSIGLMSLAQNSKILVTPTDDLGKILNTLHVISTGGITNISVGLQKAHLTLKHRLNRNQQMRIVMFIASPIQTNIDELKIIGKRLKKNNVAVDIISLGDYTTNDEKLEVFIHSVNKSNNSKLIKVPRESNIATTILDDSRFTNTRSAFAASAVSSSLNYQESGDEDSELALALRISLEEERKRQEQQAIDELKDTDSPPSEEDEDNLLQHALLLSQDDEKK